MLRNRIDWNSMGLLKGNVIERYELRFSIPTVLNKGNFSIISCYSKIKIKNDRVFEWLCNNY